MGQPARGKMKDDHVVRFSKYAGMMNFVWMSLAWPPVQICLVSWLYTRYTSILKPVSSCGMPCSGSHKPSKVIHWGAVDQVSALFSLPSWPSLMFSLQEAEVCSWASSRSLFLVLTQSILRYVNTNAGHHDDHPGHVPHWGAVDQEAEVPTHPLLMNWRPDALLPAISIPMNFPSIEVNPASRSLRSN